jgi:hypothetical protein
VGNSNEAAKPSELRHRSAAAIKATRPATSHGVNSAALINNALRISSAAAVHNEARNQRARVNSKALSPFNVLCPASQAAHWLMGELTFMPTVLDF